MTFLHAGIVRHLDRDGERLGQFELMPLTIVSSVHWAADAYEVRVEVLAELHTPDGVSLQEPPLFERRYGLDEVSDADEARDLAVRDFVRRLAGLLAQAG